MSVINVILQSFIGRYRETAVFYTVRSTGFPRLDTMDYFEGLDVAAENRTGKPGVSGQRPGGRYCGCDERRCGSFRRSCIAGRHKSSYNKRWSREGCESSFRKKNTVGQRYRSLRRAVLSWNRLNRRRISVSEAGWTYDRSRPGPPWCLWFAGKIGARSCKAFPCGILRFR